MLTAPERSMHRDFTTAEPSHVVVKLDIWMVGQQRHRHRGVGHTLRNHQSGQTLTERIVMISGLPDRDFFCFPGFHWTHSDRLSRNERNVSAPAGPGVLGNR